MTPNPHTPDCPVRLVTAENLHLNSLVLSSVNIDHTVQNSAEGQFLILVREDDLLKAQYELETFETENSNWPPAPPGEETFAPLFRAHSLMIVGLLSLFFAATGPWTPHALWFAAGSAESVKILEQGELYRLVTALTLHADIVHLLGNTFLGAVLLHFFFHITGNGIGSASLLAASAGANYINALLHGPGHNSVGFSTAVFSVIGILSVLNYNRYRLKRPMQILMPLMAGSALLAMLGSSGERTDLGAHLFGLLCGFCTGGILVWLRFYDYRENLLLQFTLGGASLAVPLFCWFLAMT